MSVHASNTVATEQKEIMRSVVKRELSRHRLGSDACLLDLVSDVAPEALDFALTTISKDD